MEPPPPRSSIDSSSSYACCDLQHRNFSLCVRSTSSPSSDFMMGGGAYGESLPSLLGEPRHGSVDSLSMLITPTSASLALVLPPPPLAYVTCPSSSALPKLWKQQQLSEQTSSLVVDKIAATSSSSSHVLTSLDVIGDSFSPRSLSPSTLVSDPSPLSKGSPSKRKLSVPAGSEDMEPTRKSNKSDLSASPTPQQNTRRFVLFYVYPVLRSHIPYSGRTHKRTVSESLVLFNLVPSLQLMARRLL